MNQSMHQNVADDSRTKQNFSRHNFSTHAQLLRPNKKNPLFRVTLLTFKIRVGRSASLFFLFIFFLGVFRPESNIFCRDLEKKSSRIATFGIRFGRVTPIRGIFYLALGSCKLHALHFFAKVTCEWKRRGGWGRWYSSEDFETDVLKAMFM